MATSGKKGLENPVLARLAGKGKHKIGLSMAPMIDIIFLLLIFFLVAGQWRGEENFLPFKLPVAEAGTISIGRPEAMVLRISKTAAGCSVQIAQGSQVEIADMNVEADLVLLMGEIEKCMRQQKRFATDPIELVCQAKVRWEQIVKIYNMLYGAGASDITFTITEQGRNE